MPTGRLVRLAGHQASPLARRRRRAATAVAAKQRACHCRPSRHVHRSRGGVARGRHALPPLRPQPGRRAVGVRVCGDARRLGPVVVLGSVGRSLLATRHNSN